MTTQLNTLYPVEPAALTRMSSFLQDTVRYQSLSMMNIPIVYELDSLQQKYEWSKKNFNVGTGYEMDVISPPDATGFVEKKEVETPVIFTNYTFPYDDYRRMQGSVYDIQARLADQLGIMALRADAIAYGGDTKHSVNSLGTATPGTEVTTPLNVSTVLLAADTFSKMFKQLKTALKHNALISPAATVIIEMNPDIYQIASAGQSANQDFSVLQKIKKMLLDDFGPMSRVVPNPYLAATFSINSAGVLEITEGTDHILTYVQDPRIMKLIASKLEIRVSNLDETKGITYQPIQRFTRVDVEPLGVLIETNTTTA